MQHQVAGRGAGRPRKHASATARNAAWRTKRGLIKVTVELPEPYADDIRRRAKYIRDNTKYSPSIAPGRYVRYYPEFDPEFDPPHFTECPSDVLVAVTLRQSALSPPKGSSNLDLLKWLYEHCLNRNERTKFLASIGISGTRQSGHRWDRLRR
jgi:hypothetical protein